MERLGVIWLPFYFLSTFKEIPLQDSITLIPLPSIFKLILFVFSWFIFNTMTFASFYQTLETHYKCTWMSKQKFLPPHSKLYIFILNSLLFYTHTQIFLSLTLYVYNISMVMEIICSLMMQEICNGWVTLDGEAGHVRTQMRSIGTWWSYFSHVFYSSNTCLSPSPSVQSSMERR